MMIERRRTTYFVSTWGHGLVLEFGFAKDYFESFPDIGDRMVAAQGQTVHVTLGVWGATRLRVDVEVLERAPDPLSTPEIADYAPERDRVEDVVVRGAGVLVIAGFETAVVTDINLDPPGVFGVRVWGRGRGVEYDLSVDEPVAEHYLVQIWQIDDVLPDT